MRRPRLSIGQLKLKGPLNTTNKLPVCFIFKDEPSRAQGFFKILKKSESKSQPIKDSSSFKISLRIKIWMCLRNLHLFKKSAGHHRVFHNSFWFVRLRTHHGITIAFRQGQALMDYVGTRITFCLKLNNFRKRRMNSKM